MEWNGSTRYVWLACLQKTLSGKVDLAYDKTNQCHVVIKSSDCKVLESLV